MRRQNFSYFVIQQHQASNQLWTVMSIGPLARAGPFARRRLNLLLRATLESVVYSQCFSHTTNEKKEVNKSF